MTVAQRTDGKVYRIEPSRSLPGNIWRQAAHRLWPNMLFAEGAIVEDDVAYCVQGNIAAHLDHFADNAVAQAHRVVDSWQFGPVEAKFLIIAPTRGGCALEE